jgi:hypothetical protein
MGAVYYKSKQTGEYFKVEITTDNPEHIDTFLDQFNNCAQAYITEEKFLSAYDQYMSVDIKTEDSSEIIGVLTCKKQDINEGDLIG